MKSAIPVKLKHKLNFLRKSAKKRVGETLYWKKITYVEEDL